MRRKVALWRLEKKKNTKTKPCFLSSQRRRRLTMQPAPARLDQGRELLSLLRISSAFGMCHGLLKGP